MEQGTKINGMRRYPACLSRRSLPSGTRPGRRSPVGRAAGPGGGRFPDGEADGSGVDVYRHRGYRLETQGPEARDGNQDEGPALLAWQVRPWRLPSPKTRTRQGLGPAK